MRYGTWYSRSPTDLVLAGTYHGFPPGVVDGKVVELRDRRTLRGLERWVSVNFSESLDAQVIL